MKLAELVSQSWEPPYYFEDKSDYQSTPFYVSYAEVSRTIYKNMGANSAGIAKVSGSQLVWRYCPTGITLTNERTFFVVISSVMAGFGTSLLVDKTQKKILTSNILLHLYDLNLEAYSILHIKANHFFHEFNIC